MNLSTNKTIIRSADENDAESILVLVRELALYENAADQVTATVHDYESNLKKGKIFCKIAEVDHKMVGIALYYETFSPDTDTSDGSFIVSEKYIYGVNQNEVWYYKVVGGGHDWPGSGGNMDIEAGEQ